MWCPTAVGSLSVDIARAHSICCLDMVAAILVDVGKKCVFVDEYTPSNTSNNGIETVSLGVER
jgi:hypothetical protein